MENRVSNIKARRQVKAANPESHKGQVKTLSQLVSSESIRAAREKVSGKPEPASVSNTKKLDKKAAGALRSNSKQLSFDLKLEESYENGKGLASESSEVTQEIRRSDSQISETTNKFGHAGNLQEQTMLPGFKDNADIAKPDVADNRINGNERKHKANEVSARCGDDVKSSLAGSGNKNNERLTEPLVSAWLETIASIATDIARRESIKRKE